MPDPSTYICTYVTPDPSTADTSDDTSHSD